MLNELLRQPAGENEKLMFDLLWESGLLGTLTSAIEFASSQMAISHIRALVIECSKVAAYFNMNEYIHKLLSILCQCFISLLRLHKLKVLPNQLIELDDFIDEDGNPLPMSRNDKRGQRKNIFNRLASSFHKFQNARTRLIKQLHFRSSAKM